MDRRQLLIGSSATLVATNLAIIDGAEASARLHVRITTAVRRSDESPLDELATKVITVQRNSSIATALTKLADITDRQLAIGSNPTWKYPGEVIGRQLLQFGDWRNWDMPPMPNFPANAIEGQWWMIFLGPTKYLDAGGRVRNLPPIELLSNNYCLSNPTASVTTVKVDRIRLDQRRWCDPAIFAVYTFPNGPWR